MKTFYKAKLWIKWFEYGIRCCPFIFTMQLLLVIVSASVSGYITLYGGKMLDAAVAYATNGKTTDLIYSVLLLVGLSFVLVTMGIFDTCLNGRRDIAIKLQNSKKLADVIIGVDALTMQNPEYAMKYNRINSITNSNPSQTDAIAILSTVSDLVISIILMRTFISNIYFYHVIFMFLIFIITAISSVFISKRRNSFYEQNWDEQRKLNHFGEIPFSLSAAKENYMFNFFDYVINKWQKATKNMSAKRIRLNSKDQTYIFLCKALPLILPFLIILQLYAQGSLATVGQFSVLLAFMLSIIRSGGSIAYAIGNTYNTATLYEHYEDYLKYVHVQIQEQMSPSWQEDGEDSNIKNDEHLIKITKMDFSYDKNSKAMLKNINLNIPKAQVVAIVGPNGSGKSTLVKLIAGIYKPDAGRIVVDGCDPWEKLNLHHTSNIAMIMQSFGIYKGISIKENIIFGDERNNSELFNKIAKIGFDESNVLLDSLVGEEFGGTNLSVGQWQKIAILRSLLHKKSIVIFDEPTSALDPIAERDLYEQILNANKGNTVIMVTHRLGSIRKANHIIVLNDGHVVEQGNHESLMSIEDGLYKNMFLEQASWYAI